MKKIILACPLFLSSLCLADAANFTKIEASYIEQSIEILSEDIDFNGFEVNGSYQFYDNFFFKGRYRDISLDDDLPGIDADGDFYAAGIGYIFGANEAGSFWGSISYASGSYDISADIDDDGSDDTFLDSDESGYMAEVGFRMNTSERSELNLSFAHIDLDAWDDNMVTGEFVFDFTENFSGIATLSYISGDPTYGVGVRYSLPGLN